MAYIKPSPLKTTGTQQIKLDARARMGSGKITSFVGNMSAKVTDVLEAKVSVPCSDSYTPLLDFVGTGESAGDGKSLGSLSNKASGAKFIGISNTGSCSLDIGFKNKQWRAAAASADVEQTSDGSNYTKEAISSFLLHPGEFIALPTNRMVTYNPSVFSANEAASTALTLDGTTSSVTTDGTGYVAHENHGWVPSGEGIVPGSCVFAFCRPAYTAIGLASKATNSQSSGLAANTAYAFKLEVDTVDTADISFTTDATDVSWGGTNGIINKVNSALSAAGLPYVMKIIPSNDYYDDDDLGDIGFIHNKAIDGTSQIAWENPGSGTTPGGVGIWPAAASQSASAPAYMFGKDYLAYDNGYGSIYRRRGGYGILSYEPAHCTTFYNMPVYSSIKGHFRHGSAHSGDTEGTTDDGLNIIKNVMATTIHPGGTGHNLSESYGQITITLFS